VSALWPLLLGGLYTLAIVVARVVGVDAVASWLAFISPLIDILGRAIPAFDGVSTERTVRVRPARTRGGG
jgi:hypothetical protein